MEYSLLVRDTPRVGSVLHSQVAFADASYGDGVEAHDGPPAAVLTDPMPRHLRNLAALAPGYRLEGVPETVSFAPFHLDERECTATRRDQVDLFSTEPIVPGKNPPSPRKQMFGCHPLEAASRTMRVHHGGSPEAAGAGMPGWVRSELGPVPALAPPPYARLGTASGSGGTRSRPMAPAMTRIWSMSSPNCSG